MVAKKDLTVKTKPKPQILMGDTKLIVSNNVCIKNMPRALVKSFKRDLQMDNPKYHDAFKNGRYIPVDLMPIIRFFGKEYDDWIVPAGYLKPLVSGIQALEHDYDIHYQTVNEFLDFELIFKGKLRPYQRTAKDAILEARNGILEARTGSGKTVVGIGVVVERAVSTLIIVHSKELLHQWYERIEEFTGYKAGRIGDGHKTIRPITIGIINTVHKQIDKLDQKFSQVIFDECHRVMGESWQTVAQAMNCHYRVGLSATPFRRDGLDKGMFALIGPIIHKVDPKVLHDSGAVLKPRIIRKQTTFMYQFRNDYSDMIHSLCTDENRNQLIVDSVINDYRVNKEPLLLVSDRVTHCKILKDLLKKKGFNAEILSGKVGKKERDSIVKRMKFGLLDIVISTVSLISEGFDSKNLSALFLCTPIKFKGRAIQSIGRILRPKDTKRVPRLYDFRDMEVDVLRFSGFHRDKTYKLQGW